MRCFLFKKILRGQVSLATTQARNHQNTQAMARDADHKADYKMGAGNFIRNARIL